MKYIIYSAGDFPVLNISSIGFSDDIQVTHFGPASRNLYIIHYVLRGKGYFNGHAVSAGEGFLIRPGDFEHYYADERCPWEFLWIVSSDVNMAKTFEMYNANEHNTFKFDFASSLKETVSRLKALNGCIITRCEALDIFLGIMKHHERSVTKSEYKADKSYVDFAVSYIASNLHSEISVSGIADIIGVSRPYLYKIFLDALGKSPKAYINDERLSRAKMLLKETSMSVTDIAGSVGYPDVLCFSRFFSRKMGISPTEYRSRA